MWLLGWLVRVLLLLLAPVYFLFQFAAESLARLDQWAWRAIQTHASKKQAESAAPESAHRKAS
jgi:hypothetical protein